MWWILNEEQGYSFLNLGYDIRSVNRFAKINVHVQEIKIKVKKGTRSRK
jgi:hypothetical protein